MLLYVKLTTGIRALIAILTEYTVFVSRIRDTCLAYTTLKVNAQVVTYI